MKSQNAATAAAKETAKKNYTKPLINKFGRVADLTASGSAGMFEMGGGQPQKKS